MSSNVFFQYTSKCMWASLHEKRHWKVYDAFVPNVWNDWPEGGILPHRDIRQQILQNARKFRRPVPSRGLDNEIQMFKIFDTCSSDGETLEHVNTWGSAEIFSRLLPTFRHAMTIVYLLHTAPNTLHIWCSGSLAHTWLFKAQMESSTLRQISASRLTWGGTMGARDCSTHGKTGLLLSHCCGASSIQYWLPIGHVKSRSILCCLSALHFLVVIWPTFMPSPAITYTAPSYIFLFLYTRKPLLSTKVQCWKERLWKMKTAKDKNMQR